MSEQINVYIDLGLCEERNKEAIEMLVLKGVILQNVKSRYPAWIVE